MKIHFDNKSLSVKDFESADGLTVGGSLYLSGTGITKLPDGLTVRGSLYLSGTGITKLPDGLTVGGSLDLSGTGITNVVYGGADERGYEFYGVWMKTGFRIVAGCRNFNVKQAVHHWTNNGNVRVLAIVEKLLAEAEKRWPDRDPRQEKILETA